MWRRWRRFGAAALLVGAAGCGPKPPPAANGPAPAPQNAPAPKQAPPAKAAPLTGTSAGPVKIGMAPEAVKALPGAVVSETDLRLEGTPSPALRVQQNGKVQMIAELHEGKVWRIRVLDPGFNIMPVAKTVR